MDQKKILSFLLNLINKFHWLELFENDLDHPLNTQKQDFFLYLLLQTSAEVCALRVLLLRNNCLEEYYLISLLSQLELYLKHAVYGGIGLIKTCINTNVNDEHYDYEISICVFTTKVFCIYLNVLYLILYFQKLCHIADCFIKKILYFLPLLPEVKITTKNY